MGPILALPGALAAAEHAVSSNIERDLGLALDRIQQESQLQALYADFQKTYTGGATGALDPSAAPVRISAGAATAISFEALPLPAASGWSELAAYETLRLESLDRQRLARERTPCELAPTPPLSGPGVLSADRVCPGASLSRGGALVAIRISTADRATRETIAPLPATVAAIELGLRDYYAIRNGYYGDAPEADRITRPSPELASPAAFAVASDRTVIRLPFSVSISSFSFACESSFAASAFFVSMFRAWRAPHLAAGYRSNFFGDHT